MNEEQKCFWWNYKVLLLAEIIDNLALLKGKRCSILSLLGRNFLYGKSVMLQEEEECIYNLTVAYRLNMVLYFIWESLQTEYQTFIQI
jgi:hypothetical protein